MPLNCVTGLPGHGKTLFTIDKLRKETKDRKVYQHGIKGLALGWELLEDATKWQDCADGSIIIIDEAWKVFPIRGTGSKVPEYVEGLATHRHRGIDIWLVTQHPMQLDTFVRRLIDGHHHIRRSFGMQRATVHTFPQLQQEPDKSRTESIRTEWSYPKDVFALYESAELHTVKRQIPIRVWLMFILPLLAVGAIYAAYYFLSARFEKPKSVPVLPVASELASPPPAAPDRHTVISLTPEQDHTPRIPYLPHTAPVFDQVAQVTQAPTPSGCIASRTRCICYTQQATPLPIPEELCRTWAEGGYFDAYRRDPARPTAAAS